MGRGPVPKPAHQLAGHGAAKKRLAGMKIIESEPTPQPPLPELMPNGEPWPERTVQWWDMWATDPLAKDFRATDWSELMDTAVVHGAFWAGESKLAAELRLRTGKFGSTQEDRARLRIQYAAADEADEKRRSSKAGANARGVYKGLRAVDD